MGGGALPINLILEHSMAPFLKELAAYQDLVNARLLLLQLWPSLSRNDSEQRSIRGRCW